MSFYACLVKARPLQQCRGLLETICTDITLTSDGGRQPRQSPGLIYIQNLQNSYLDLQITPSSCSIDNLVLIDNPDVTKNPNVYPLHHTWQIISSNKRLNGCWCTLKYLHCSTEYLGGRKTILTFEIINLSKAAGVRII